LHHQDIFCSKNESQHWLPPNEKRDLKEREGKGKPISFIVDGLDVVVVVVVVDVVVGLEWKVRRNVIPINDRRLRSFL